VTEDPAPTDDGEALRRRLYRPGAGGPDVDAYLAVADPEPPPGPPPPRERRPRSWAVLVAVVVALLVVGVLLPRTWDRTAPAAASTPLPTRPVSAATSARFVAALETGHDAGLGAWFDPGAPLVEQHGTGDAVIELPPSGSAAGGTLEVLLVLAADGTAGWQTARLVITRTHAILREPEAGAGGALRAGVPTVARVVYPVDHRPLRLLVRAPAGVRWGVAAVFTR
jgi:hypothetical protein